MMARTLLTPFLLFFSLSLLHAQDSPDSERWLEGFLVTVTDDTIRGDFCHDMTNNTVKWHGTSGVQVFSSFQTFYYKVYDEEARRWRQFYSIPYALKNDHRTPVLFELLSEGKLSLLARERWKNTVENDEMERARLLRKDYFFIDRAGEIRYTNGRKSQLLALMSDQEKEVRQYIRQNYLDLTRESALRMVTTYYNKRVFESENEYEKDLMLSTTYPASDLILGTHNEGIHPWQKTGL